MQSNGFLKVDPLTLLFLHHLSGFNCGFDCIAEMASREVTIILRKMESIG
jgi:hypothetical protein